jgi:hypothetical protein
MDSSNRQLTLKPQDLVVLLKMACHRDRSFTYAQLAEELGIAASEAHSCLRRASLARLATQTGEGSMAVQRIALREFVLHGAKYSFPASTGSTTRGIPTGYAAPPLRDVIVQPDELPPVWPQPDGPTRGIALYPLYPTVPGAAARDERLYECLTLFDALRAGAAREREMAQQLLSERL